MRVLTCRIVTRSVGHLIRREQDRLGRVRRVERRVRHLLGRRRVRLGRRGGQQHRHERRPRGGRVVRPDDLARRGHGRVPRRQAQDQRAVGPLRASWPSAPLSRLPPLHPADILHAPSLRFRRRSASRSSSSSRRSSSSPSSTVPASSTRAAAAATRPSARSRTSLLSAVAGRAAGRRRRRVDAARGASRAGVTLVRALLVLLLLQLRDLSLS